MTALTVSRLLPLAAALALPATAARPKLYAREPSWYPAEMTCHHGAAPAAAVTGSPVKPVSPPATTEAPDMAETLARLELMKRAFTTGPDTCGYYYDDSIYKCDAGLNCAVSGSIFGCCRGANCGATSSNFFTTCLDYSEPACVSTLQGYFTLCCTSINWPYCYTGVSSYQGRSVTHYGCGNNVFTGYQPIVGTPRYASEISTTPSYTISVVTTPARPSTPSAPGNGGSAPVGAIVGGVIGGLAVISLTVFLIFWFAIKNKNSAAPPPMPGPQMAYAGAPGQPYDPNAPQNGQMLQPNVTGYPPSMNPGSPPPPSYVDPRFSTMGGYYAPNNGGVVNGKDLWSPTSTAPMLAPQNTGLSVDQQPSSGPTSPISSPNPDAAQLPSGPQQAQGQVGPYGQPLNQPVYEAPATNPAGMGNNRAELG